jgi:hypothetical protein
MRQTFRTADVRRVTAASAQNLNDWANAGVIRAADHASGKRHNRRFTWIELAALTIAIATRRHGGTLSMMGSIVRFISRMKEEQLRASIARGDDRLILVDGIPVEKLTSLDEMAASTALAKVRSAQAPLTIINIRGVIDALDKRISAVKTARESN